MEDNARRRVFLFSGIMRMAPPGFMKLFSAWPMVRWVLALVIGIVLWRNGVGAPSLTLVFASIALSAGILFFQHPVFGALRSLLGFILLIGAGLLAGHLQEERLRMAKSLRVFHGDTLTVAGTVADQRINARGARTFRLEADSLLLPGASWIHLPFLVITEWPQPVPSLYDTAGVLKIVLSDLPEPTTAGRFDYRQWLLDQGITHRGRVVAFVSGAAPSGLKSVRNRIFRAIDTHIPAENRGLVKALLTGYRHEIPSEMKARYADSGLSHLMAVSGLHVAFVMAPFLAFFFWLGIGGWRKHVLMAVMALLLISYSLLTGASASVIRASLMLVLFTAARVYQQRSSAANILATTAFISLLIRPSDIFGASFQLSYGAVASLMLFAQPVSNLLPRKWQKTWYGNLILVAPLSAVVQIALTPLLAWYFEKVSIIGPLANIPALYLAQVVVISGAATVLLDLLIPQLAWLPAFLTSWSATGIDVTARFLGELNTATIPVQMQNPFVFVIWITLAGFISRLGHRVFRIRWLILFLIACIASVAVPMVKQSLEKPALTVTFFDVGQGDAALVRTTEGKTLLIDTGGLRGSQPAAALSIVPELLHHQIDTLDAVILTHDHLDHTAGLSTIQHKIGVRTLYVPPDARADAFSKAMRGLFSKKAASHGTVVKTVAAGDILPLAPSVFAGVVAPLPSFVRERDKNMTSVGLLLVHGETRYLFTGDLPSEGEKEIARHFGNLLDADVIKAAHHGSKYSSSTEWLAATTPRIVITSSAMENRYGHPHAEAVLRFRQTGGALFHTALHGTIRVIDNGLPEQLVVKTARGTYNKP